MKNARKGKCIYKYENIFSHFKSFFIAIDYLKEK